MGRGKDNYLTEDIFYGDDLSVFSEEAAPTEENEWKTVEFLFDSLFEVSRNYKTLKKDEKGTPLIATWNSLQLYDSNIGTRIFASISIEATESRQPLLRTTLFESGSEEFVEVVYSGRSLEAAARAAIESIDELEDDDVYTKARKALFGWKDKIEALGE